MEVNFVTIFGIRLHIITCEVSTVSPIIFYMHFLYLNTFLLFLNFIIITQVGNSV